MNVIYANDHIRSPNAMPPYSMNIICCHRMLRNSLIRVVLRERIDHVVSNLKN